MSSSTAAALRQPQNLAELLDGRPDTREMISANLNLAHACLLLKQGEAEDVDRALALAQQTPSKGMATISRCIRAEVLRLHGEQVKAWDLAEELVHEDRFDTVAALYLRFLFPFHKKLVEPEAVAEPVTTEKAPESEFVSQNWDDAPAATPVAIPESVQPEIEAESVVSHDSVVPSVVDSESEVSLSLDEPPPAIPDDSETPAIQELPGVLGKISQDTGILLLRLRQISGEVSEVVRPSNIVQGSIDTALLDRPRQVLANLGFGALVHASFESAQGAAHSWIREGRTLVLVADGSTSAPALAARCTRAMEEGS